MSDTFDSDDTIDLGDLLVMLQHWWLLVVALPLAIGLLTYFALGLQPASYRASAVVPLTTAPSEAVLQPIRLAASRDGLDLLLSDDGRQLTISATGTSPQPLEDSVSGLIATIAQTPALDAADRAVAVARSGELEAHVTALQAALKALQAAPPSASATGEYNPATYGVALATLLDVLSRYEEQQRLATVASPLTLSADAAVPVVTTPLEAARLPMALFAGAASLALVLVGIVAAARRRRPVA